MRMIEAIIASTNLDLQGERLTREALSDLVASIERKYIPLGVQHDPREAPIGRLVSASVRDLEDDESEVVAMLEIFEHDDGPDERPDHREIALQARDNEIAVTYDWTYRDHIDQEDISAIGDIFGTEPVYEGKKAAEPISVVTLIAGVIAGGIASGFLNQVGADAWTHVKARLSRLFSRTDNRKGDQLLKFSFLQERNGAQFEVVVVVTNPTSNDIDGVLRQGLAAVEHMVPLYVNQIPDLRRLTFEYKEGQSTFLFGVSKDCRPWREVVKDSEPMRQVTPLRFALFKDSEASFLQALSDNHIAYKVIEPKSGVVMASGTMIELLQTVATSGAIAAVMVAWLKARSSRKIVVTTRDNTVVHLEGYSVKEAQAILQLMKSAAIIDTKPPDPPDAS